MKNRLALCASFMLIISARSAWAQEKGQIGLTMGYPSAAGVQWHATGRVAARATITFSRFSTESAIAIPDFPLADLIAPSRTSSTSSAISVGLSGLFYLSKADGV